MYALAFSYSTFKARTKMSSAVKIPVDSIVTKLELKVHMKWSPTLPNETPYNFIHSRHVVQSLSRTTATLPFFFPKTCAGQQSTRVSPFFSWLKFY